MNNDIHDSVYDEIELRINTLRSGAPASSPGAGAKTQDEVDAEVARLEKDKEVLLDHWKIRNGVVGATPHCAPRARACGQEQPCPQVLELAETYGIL